jgi:hypothetical protein
MKNDERRNLMKRYKIIFPTGEQMDYLLDDTEIEFFQYDEFPLMDHLRRHITTNRMESTGARVFEVYEGEIGRRLIYLTEL